MKERIEVNLLPAEYRFHFKHFDLKREIIYPFLLLILTIVIFGWWTIWLTAQIGYYEKKIAEVDKKIQENSHILKEINKLKKQKTLIQKKIRALERIDVNREKWIRLQEVFCQKLPKSTWLDKINERDTSLTVGNNVYDLVDIDGKTYAFSEVAQFMLNLTESEFINAVDLEKIEQINAREKIFKFSILCHVNADARLRSLSEIGK